MWSGSGKILDLRLTTSGRKAHPPVHPYQTGTWRHPASTDRRPEKWSSWRWRLPRSSDPDLGPSPAFWSVEYCGRDALQVPEANSIAEIFWQHITAFIHDGYGEGLPLLLFRKQWKPTGNGRNGKCINAACDKWVDQKKQIQRRGYRFMAIMRHPHKSLQFRKAAEPNEAIVRAVQEEADESRAKMRWFVQQIMKEQLLNKLLKGSRLCMHVQSAFWLTEHSDELIFRSKSAAELMVKRSAAFLLLKMR